MRKRLRNYFDMTKGEFNGLMTLVMLIFVVSWMPAVYNWLWPAPVDPLMEQEAEAHFRKLMQDQRHAPAYASAKKNYPTAIPLKSPLRLQRFDPNTTDLAGWQNLGFSAKQAQSILNYRKKGGQFRKPEDLQKMYVVSPAAYQKLRPYIAIAALPPTGSPHRTSEQQYKYISERPKAKVPPAHPLVEINYADTSALESIRGIGPAFAKRIIQYRERIGGFHKKEQLMEVYGLDPGKFDEIKDQVLVDPSAITRLNVNTIRIEDFKNNPYIRYKQVNAIIQYREQHGNYSNFDDLKKVIILTPQVLEQLSPYISFVP
jgi:competence protein ComEA